ncbi:hypothetical protein [Deinococcus xinjiangensis]
MTQININDIQEATNRGSQRANWSDFADSSTHAGTAFGLHPRQ